MTLQQLKKQVTITQILGITAPNNQTELYIKSPFRSENTASFKVNLELNSWYDFGIGQGGSAYDLIQKLYNFDGKETYNYLLKLANNGNTIPYQTANVTATQTATNTAKNYTIKKIQNLQNTALLNYIKSRKIALNVAKKYLKEIYFISSNNKNYFGICWENKNGNYEYRNKYQKGCLGAKDITIIQHKNSQKVAIFEGYLDFLSALTYYNTLTPNSNIIVLNSVTNVGKLDLKDYSEIILFLDNDTAGETAKKSILAVYPTAKDYSSLYRNYGDFNEFLTAKA